MSTKNVDGRLSPRSAPIDRSDAIDDAGGHRGLSAGSRKRLVPLAVLVAGIIAFFASGLNKVLTFDQLRTHRGDLMAYVASMPVKAILLFTASYAAAVAFSIPGGAIMTLTAGFLFGIWFGTAAVVVGATLGATILFLAARSALADLLRGKAGPWLTRMEEGFRENAFSYLLVLRLIPAVPFFVVNLVPAFLGVPLRIYILATLIGIVPGTFVFASIGAGLGSIFDRMEAFTLKGALTPEIVIALVGLAALALIPVIYRKLSSRGI